MSVHYGIVGYPDVPRADARDALRLCEETLRATGWIVGAEDPEAAYDPRGPTFRPGPASGIETTVHPLPDGTVLKSIDGVAFCGPCYLNHGPFIGGPNYRCPACGAVFEAGQESAAKDAQQQRCFDLLDMYFKGDAPLREVACVACEAMVDINAMVDGGAEFVLSDVAIEFWNWPPDSIEAAAAVLDACLGRRHRPGWVRI